MSPVLDDILIAYGKNPYNQGPMEHATISHEEESRLCTDRITVYLRISEAGIIEDFSFEWYLAIVTTACASVYGESIVGMPVSEIVTHTYDTMRDILGTDVSSRRRPSAVFALLATRNALHRYLGDGRADDFSDIFL